MSASRKGVSVQPEGPGRAPSSPWLSPLRDLEATRGRSALAELALVRDSEPELPFWVFYPTSPSFSTGWDSGLGKALPSFLAKQGSQLSALHSAREPELDGPGELVANLREQPCWQQPIGDRGGVARISGTKVWARPDEAVRFCDDDPRGLIVQAKPGLGRRWNFDRELGNSGGSVGHGKDDDDGVALIVLGGHHNSAGTVLLTFLLTAVCLFTPKERIADDEPGLGFREGHAGLFQFVIECG